MQDTWKEMIGMGIFYKKSFKLLLLLFFLAGCAGLEKPWDRFTPADLKLLRVEMPQVVHEDLPYAVHVTFQSRGAPPIERACIRWVAEEFGSPSPSLTCYAFEVSSDQPIGSACTRWLADGPYADVSPLFCTDVENVRYGEPGSFIVRIHTRNVKLYYNRMDVYAEYIVDGEIRTTNTVSTRIRVER